MPAAVSALPASDAASAPPPRRREFWITLVGSLFLRVLALTLRFRLEDPERLSAERAGAPFVLVFWHNRLLLIPILWNRYFARWRQEQGMALTSTSRDGELIAQFLTRFGIGPVRGSATRRGLTAVRELARLLRGNHDVAITPDGSRGPLYEIKGGLVTLAQITGAPVLPISWECSRAWRLKTWDRFLIPKPFATVTFRVGESFPVPRTASPGEFEEQRRRCEAAMMRLVQTH